MRVPHSVSVVLFACLVAVQARSQEQPPEVLPKVIQHAPPIYPPLARQTRISGDVRLKITTDGESVLDVEVESGHPLLKQAAVDNVKTWKFTAHQAGRFEVTFRYKLLSGEAETEFLECPGVVTLELPPPELIIDYADISLGTWKAEFTTGKEKLPGTLKLYYSRAKGEWLGANFKPEKARMIESDYGYKEGAFLVFDMRLKQADGKRVKTFFAGKIMKDKIVGTFVDDGGSTGEWTATRIGR